MSALELLFIATIFTASGYGLRALMEEHAERKRHDPADPASSRPVLLRDRDLDLIDSMAYEGLGAAPDTTVRMTATIRQLRSHNEGMAAELFIIDCQKGRAA